MIVIVLRHECTASMSRFLYSIESLIAKYTCTNFIGRQSSSTKEGNVLIWHVFHFEFDSNVTHCSSSEMQTHESTLISNKDQMTILCQALRFKPTQS